MISFNAVTTKLGGGTPTNSFSHTIASGSNRILIVTVATYSANMGITVNGVTYSGVSLTKLRSDRSSLGSSGVTSDIWYLINPPVGTANVVVTHSTIVQTVIGAHSYTGVDQTTPFEASNGNTGTTVADTTTSNTILTANSWLIESFAYSSAINATPQTGQTVLYSNLDHGNASGAAGREGPLATGSHSSTWRRASAFREAALTVGVLKVFVDVGRKIKVWNGTSWVEKNIKVFNGTEWVNVT